MIFLKKIFKFRKKGFGLVEIIIAIFILSVGILAVLAMFPLGIKTANSSKMATVAAELAQEKIEEFISKPYIDISSEAKEVLIPPLGNYSRETQVTCFDPNLDLSPNCPDETGIKKIKVIVYWRSPFGANEKSIEFSTLISQR